MLSKITSAMAIFFPLLNFWGLKWAKQATSIFGEKYKGNKNSSSRIKCAIDPLHPKSASNYLECHTSGVKLWFPRPKTHSRFCICNKGLISNLIGLARDSLDFMGGSNCKKENWWIWIWSMKWMYVFFLTEKGHMLWITLLNYGEEKYRIILM